VLIQTKTQASGSKREPTSVAYGALSSSARTDVYPNPDKPSAPKGNRNKQDKFSSLRCALAKAGHDYDSSRRDETVKFKKRWKRTQTLPVLASCTRSTCFFAAVSNLFLAVRRHSAHNIHHNEVPLAQQCRIRADERIPAFNQLLGLQCNLWYG
jgi:hypothetical protein